MEHYLLIGYGESDEPEMIFAVGRDGVRGAIARLIFGSEGDAVWSEVDAMMVEFDDGDGWSMYGCRIEFRFEIGGIEITRLTTPPTA